MRLKIFGVLVFFVTLLAAGPAAAEFALGGATTVSHGEGNYAATARYDFRDKYLGVYGLYFNGNNGANNALAADLTVPYKMLDFSLGGAYVGKTTRVNGTHYNFSLRIGANLLEHWRLEVIHLSNGNAIFGWQKDKYNLGWNFVGVAYRF